MSEGMTLPSDVPRGKPCCGVTAVAIAAGVSFSEAWDVIKRYGNHGSGWRGRTYGYERQCALEHFKVRRQHVVLPRRMTLETWIAKHAERDVRYLVNVTGHMVVTRNYVVLDQNGPKNVFLHWSRRKRVRHVMRIEP